MRILVVSPWLGDRYGQERIVAESARLLQSRGHQVFGMTTNLEVSGTPSYLNDVRVVPNLNSCHFLKGPNVVEQVLQDSKTYLEKIKPDIIHLIDGVDPRIFGLFKEVAPTILSIHSVGATCPSSTRVINGKSVCAKKSGYACLLHDLSYHCLSKYGGPARRTMSLIEHMRRHASLEKYAAVVPVSQYTKDLILQEGVPESKVHLIHNPVSIPENVTRVRDVPSPLLVCVARLVSLKGISLLIEACSRLKSKDWTLWICGDGESRPQVESQIAGCGLENRIKLLGHVTHSRVLEIVASARALVQSNIGPEAFGLSVAEASALGIPVVAFDIPGINEVVKDSENGLLVPSNDTSRLADAMDMLLSDNLLHQRLSKAGPQRMKRMFSPAEHIDKTVSLYELVIGRGDWLMQTSL